MKSQRIVLGISFFFFLIIFPGGCRPASSPVPLSNPATSPFENGKFTAAATHTSTTTTTHTSAATTTHTGTATTTHTGTAEDTGTPTTINSPAYTPGTSLSSPILFKAIATGDNHTCALTMDGGVKCWGHNYYGELGDGTNITRETPVDVHGLASEVVAISAGGMHTCALTSTGGVKCWGLNALGELGDGTNISRETPVDVFGLTSGVIAISAGITHTCALTSTGGVKCWGVNEYGQLGTGENGPLYSLFPMDVSGLTSDIKAISAGHEITCALSSGGGLKCWGRSDFISSVGDGTKITRKTPVDVYGLTSGVIAVSAGGTNTCALTSTGGVKCWGHNQSGQLGDGTTIYRATPVDVSGLNSGIRALDAGGASSTCVLTANGGVKCGGFNHKGQLGDGTTTDRSIPVDVVGLTDGVKAVAVGGYHTCALTSNGLVMCWGWNHLGQLGDGTLTDHITPEEVIRITP